MARDRGYGDPRLVVRSQLRFFEDCNWNGTPGVFDGIAMVEMLLGLPGMRVLTVAV